MVNTYIAKPFDVLFFRGNQPFKKGVWHTKGVFPPLPSTFAGFIRTSILLRNNIEFDSSNNKKINEIVGDDTNLPFNIIGPIVFKNISNGDKHDSIQKFFIPTPLDIFENGELVNLSEKYYKSDLNFNLYSIEYPGNNLKQFYLNWSKPLINFDNLLKYLNGEALISKDEYIKEDIVCYDEPHYGIELEYYNNSGANIRTKRTIEEHFYLTGYKRMSEDAYFWFKVDFSDDKADIYKIENIFCKLGSEGRGAIIEKTEYDFNVNSTDDLYTHIIADRKFKLLLLSPGIFRFGWTPLENVKVKDGWFIGELNGLKLKLIYSMMSNPIKISGVSYINSNGTGTKLKPTINAVPAGSVYYFEILDEYPDIEKLKKFQGGFIENELYSKMGFNQIAIGKINNGGK